MTSRPLKIAALLFSLLLAAGFVYYRTIYADQPANAPASQAASQDHRTLIYSSKSAPVISTIKPDSPAPPKSHPLATQPTSAPTSQPPASAPATPRRNIISSSSKSIGIIAPEDLKDTVNNRIDPQPQGK